MPFWKREKPTSERKVDYDKVDLMRILRESLPEAQKKNEIPCLGHALDRIQESARNELRPTTRKAYEEGILHLIPATTTITGDLKVMNFSELMNDGRFGVEGYVDPCTFFLFELVHADAFRKKGLPNFRIFEKRELWKELSVTEPVFKDETPPEWKEGCQLLASVLYQGCSASYRIMAFRDEGASSSFINNTENLLQPLAENPRDSDSVAIRVYREKQMGTEYLCFVTSLKGGGKFDYRWKHRNKVFSASSLEPKTGVPFGLTMMYTFISNRAHLK
jgi:hypothetical protein